ncbi:MAG: hypothetical protein RR847_04015 [Bacilli bacterium]
MKPIKDKMNTLLKTVIVLIIYLFYTKATGLLLNIIGIDSSIITMFIADLIFLLGIVIFYKKTIEKSIIDFKNKYQKSQKIIIIFKWVVLLFFIFIMMGILTEVFIPAANAKDDNTVAIGSLLNVSFIYTVFKTLIFAVVAEELVFKTTIRNIFSNNIIFIIVSCCVYALMNVMYADLTSPYILMDIVGYIIFAAITCICFIKNNDNIFVVMLVKFFYNLIPFTIMLLGLGS